jgi:hypothetical protein
LEANNALSDSIETTTKLKRFKGLNERVDCGDIAGMPLFDAALHLDNGGALASKLALNKRRVPPALNRNNGIELGLSALERHVLLVLPLYANRSQMVNGRGLSINESLTNPSLSIQGRHAAAGEAESLAALNTWTVIHRDARARAWFECLRAAPRTTPAMDWSCRLCVQ